MKRKPLCDSESLNTACDLAITFLFGVVVGVAVFVLVIVGYVILK